MGGLGRATRTGQRLRLTPVLPVVLYTGPDVWDSNRSLADLFDVPDSLKPWLPAWAMPLWDLSEHTVEQLLQSNEGFWQALAVPRAQNAPLDEFLQTFHTVVERLEPLGTQAPQHWHQLLTMALAWAIFRRPSREHALIIQTAETSHHTVQLQTEVKTMSHAVEQTMEQEIQERLAVATRETLRSVLRSQLQRRFQTIPEALNQRIEQANVETLRAALDQIVTVQSLDDLQL
jgi:Putative transposase, YhgA-like